MKIRSLLSLATTLVCGCHDGTKGELSLPSSLLPDPPGLAVAYAETKRKEGVMASPMKPNRPATKMQEGPPIQPSQPLLDWLNSNAVNSRAQRNRFKLPVVIRFADSHRIEIASAFLSTSEKDLPKDPIELALDGTGMSISLLTVLRQRCPQTAVSCAVWLEGYWGKLIQSTSKGSTLPSDSSSGNKRWPFAVLQVHELIVPSLPAASTRAFIEAQSELR